MALPITRPDDAPLKRVMARIAELGLKDHVIQLETVGYTTLKKALSDAQVDRARHAILDRVERNTGCRPDLLTATEDDVKGMTYLPYLLYDDEVFEEILMKESVLALVTYLLGESCLLSSLGCHFKGPGGRPLPLHSDNGNGMPAPFSTVSQVANVNYALTSYSEEAGALAMVPGSHKLARRPSEAEVMLGGEGTNPDAISMDLDPGDAVIWHGNTWHGSYARQVPGIRMNLAVYFSRQYLRTQERHGDAVPREVLDRHADDERFKVLLGGKQPYGWQLEGPDYEVMARNPRGLFD